ncbi:hypothetical protein AJ87_07195 [Rhizobium yanglingense]|nr:hypothetical protein AJ87_07195 [Rhizobium yanglingense]
MNDPTEGITEQIMRNASGEPTMLYVLIPGPTASACADTQNLDHIDARYRFGDSEGERMLAWEVPPHHTGDFIQLVKSKYISLGCAGVHGYRPKYCIAVPKTDLFRSEGSGFWSRGYFGNFDVLAVTRADL